MGPTFIIWNIIREGMRNTGDLSGAVETVSSILYFPHGPGFIFHLKALMIQNLQLIGLCSSTAANCKIGSVPAHTR